MWTDTYITVKSFSTGLYKEKGSRFLSFAYPVFSVEETKSLIDDIRKEHHGARHHCYAYLIGPEKLIYRSSDDGEPSGTAGKPILAQINSHGLTNILIVVVRYFGGKLLGAGGLTNAYRSAAESAIVNGEICELTVRDYYELTFPYSSLNEVMKVVKEDEIRQTGYNFDLDCRMGISFRVSSGERILKLLSGIKGLTTIFISRH